MINLTTGPVDITPEVIEALNSPVISHRSEEFISMHTAVTAQLCNHLDVKQSFLMTGSGTMANDAMLYQIKALKQPGIILVNGEFGHRLKMQAERLQINFTALELEWGKSFSAAKIEEQLRAHPATWILCCHCETSTGQLIDIEILRQFNIKSGINIYLDCMSTFGTMPVSLCNISMATASTAKGIGSLSGLAMIFSNIPVVKSSEVPVYLDLFHLETCKEIPFTISSNLIAGLHAALNLASRKHDWIQLDRFSNLIYEKFSSKSIIPYAQRNSRVFTLVLPHAAATKLGKHLLSSGIKTSFESQYLKDRGWIQIALFSNYQMEEIDFALKTIQTYLNLDTGAVTII